VNAAIRWIVSWHAWAAFCAAALVAACAKMEASAPAPAPAPPPPPMAADPPMPASVPPPVAAAPPPLIPPIPEFPWPPPRASTFATIPIERVLGHGLSANTTLHDVDQALTSSLARAGHVEWSYYRIPGGYALATRIESIRPDGAPRSGAARWDANAIGMDGFSLTGYLQALLTAPVGRYRVTVFMVTPEAFTSSPRAPGGPEAMAWVAAGGSRLPDAIAQLPANAQTQFRAQVYEFDKDSAAQAHVVPPPSHLLATVHLQKTGLGGWVP
jgi:hypothetical protein